MSAYLIQRTGDGSDYTVGPYLSEDVARADARDGETVVEVHGYVIASTRDGATDHTGPFADAATLSATLASMVEWDHDMYGADKVTYQITHH
ncbi:hypothetical protein [Nocardia asteroides]|uniref:hypothetical protein n=1 Tax=Nocardia asteroides TaxID=1824 RepID=UPI0034069B1C